MPDIPNILNMPDMLKCTPQLLVTLLVSWLSNTSNKKYKLTFIQRIGFDDIEYKPHHLYTKSLLDLMQMKNMHYKVEEQDDDKDIPKIA